MENVKKSEMALAIFQPVCINYTLDIIKASVFLKNLNHYSAHFPILGMHPRTLNSLTSLSNILKFPASYLGHEFVSS